MSIITSLSAIGLAALIHASFQLSVSMLTLLSGHAIGKKRAHHRLMRLTTSFLIRATLMSLLLVTFFAYFISAAFGTIDSSWPWVVACSLMLFVAVLVWVVYYRRKTGTQLWIPRVMADFLNKRVKSTKDSSEAFSLGVTSVIAELIFLAAPLFVSGLIISQLDPGWQLAGIALYTLLSVSSLALVWAIIGGGHSLSRIQKWRESNKYFLQFAAGTGLIILAAFTYANFVIGVF
jgi:hypothetical protein